MNYKRGYFSATLNNYGLIVAGGGPITYNSPLKKVEGFISSDSPWFLKSDLPTENAGGCLSTLNETAMFLMGGSNLNPSIVSVKELFFRVCFEVKLK